MKKNFNKIVCVIDKFDEFVHLIDKIISADKKVLADNLFSLSCEDNGKDFFCFFVSIRIIISWILGEYIILIGWLMSKLEFYQVVSTIAKTSRKKTQKR